MLSTARYLFSVGDRIQRVTGDGRGQLSGVGPVGGFLVATFLALFRLIISFYTTGTNRTFRTGTVLTVNVLVTIR